MSFDSDKRINFPGKFKFLENISIPACINLHLLILVYKCA